MINKVMKAVKELISLFKEIGENRQLLFRFSLNDFRARFAGNMLGIFWAFIQPIVTVLTYWFVFSVGFKTKLTDGKYPFVAFLVMGLIPWFYFSDVLISGTGVFREYSYLVKKVVFNVKLLPTMKMISNLFMHGFFFFVGVIICAIYGFLPTFHILQIFYYCFCLMAFLIGVIWITSSIQPFLPDINQFIAVIMQILIWATPILYSISSFSDHPKIVFLLKSNPLYYVVTGYREAVFSDGWFWQHPKETIYFWGVTLLLLFIGVSIFKQLRPHFSDVL
ncbi:MAG: ABC transporter permease [Streptococcaceae bacterium]|jgi:teichoic acid transport system permease protein|nr:ABC transporter permease [Streptococcaceae bacterium]